MKIIKKIIVLMLVFAVCAGVLASCGSQDDDAVASMGGKGYIYWEDEDFSDFYNLFIYFHNTETPETDISLSERNKIRRNAVNATVEMRLLEEEMEKRGLSLDMAEVEENARKDEQAFEESYPGGFAALCAQWDLSENFCVMFNKYEALKDLAKENFFTSIKVNEEEALAYYEENKNDFVKKPRYEIKEMYLQITEQVDKLTAYYDALGCIARLNLGRDWDDLLKSVEIRYNLEHGMIFSHYLTGSEYIDKPKMAKIGSVDDLKQEVSESFKAKNGSYYEDMFPQGFDKYIEKNEIKEGSAEYKKLFEAHMTYWAEMYRVERDYAVAEKWKTGKSYTSPIYHGGFKCYIVLYFASVEEEEGEISFEEAKDGIIENITEERREKAYGDFISMKMNAAGIQISYSN